MIRHLLLDLDNTLYPASGGMDEGITRRMLEFVAQFLDIPFEKARQLRSEGLPPYGTTLEWLKKEHNLLDEDMYFDFVHPESEISELQQDDKLRPYLLSLGYPLTLLTNAPTKHAERLLKFFNIENIFLGVFDLKYHKGIGKPHPDCFKSTLKAVGFSIEETIFVDDHPKYVRGYKEIGGQSVIVDEADRFADLAQKEGYYRIGSIYELGAILDSFNQSRY